MRTPILRLTTLTCRQELAEFCNSDITKGKSEGAEPAVPRERLQRRGASARVRQIGDLFLVTTVVKDFARQKLAQRFAGATRDFSDRTAGSPVRLGSASVIELMHKAAAKSPCLG